MTKHSFDRLPPKANEDIAETYKEASKVENEILEETASKYKKKIIGNKVIGALVGILLLLTLVVGGIYAYSVYIPRKILNESFDKLANAKSFFSQFESEQGEFVIKFAYDGDTGKASEFEVVLNDLGEDIEGELVLRLLMSNLEDRNDLYLQADYSEMAMLELLLSSTEFGFITKLETYGMLRPVFTGEQWLYIQGKEFDKDIRVDPDEEWTELAQMASDAILIAAVDYNYEFEGEKYKKIAIGFDKEKLLEMVDFVKDLDINAKLEQINALAKIIESSDAWDKELIEVLVDRKGYPSVINLGIAKIDNKVLQKSLKEITATEDTGKWLAPLSRSSNGVGSGEIISFGTIRLSRFNEDQGVGIPDSIVDFEELLVLIQTEVVPIIGAMMAGAMPESSNMPENEEVILEDEEIIIERFEGPENFPFDFGQY